MFTQQQIVAVIFVICILVAICACCLRFKEERGRPFVVGRTIIGFDHNNKTLKVAVSDEDWQRQHYIFGIGMVDAVEVTYSDSNLEFTIKTPSGFRTVRAGNNNFFLGAGRREIWIKKEGKPFFHIILEIVPPTTACKESF